MIVRVQHSEKQSNLSDFLGSNQIRSEFRPFPTGVQIRMDCVGSHTIPLTDSSRRLHNYNHVY